MKAILAAIDFSPVSQAVIATATELSRATGGRMILLNAVKPPTIATDLAPVVGEILEFTTEVERTARRHLRRIQKRLDERGVTVETICQQGFPVAVILAYAGDVDARYIVVGSHGHGMLHDLVIGSTPRGLLKRAACPVIVVPSLPGKRRQSRIINPGAAQRIPAAVAQ